MSDGPTLSVPQLHGLYYVSRDNNTMTRLDGQGRIPELALARPERDVMRALLAWALERVDEAPPTRSNLEIQVIHMARSHDSELALMIQKLIREGRIDPGKI